MCEKFHNGKCDTVLKLSQEFDNLKASSKQNHQEQACKLDNVCDKLEDVIDCINGNILKDKKGLIVDIKQLKWIVGIFISVISIIATTALGLFTTKFFELIGRS